MGYVFRNGDARLYISPSWARRYLQPPRASDTLYVASSLWKVGNASTTKVRKPAVPSVVLFVGAMDHCKGVDVLLQAAKILIDRGLPVRFVLAGDGPRRAEYVGLSSRLGSCGKVEFTGFVPQGPKLWTLYDSADLFVIPSRSDALPLVLIEAMGRGLPVVASRMDGIPDLVTDGGNGRLVPPGDPVALSEAIAPLFRWSATGTCYIQQPHQGRAVSYSAAEGTPDAGCRVRG